MNQEIEGAYEVQSGAKLTMRCIWFDHKWEMIFKVPGKRVYFACARKDCYAKRVQWAVKFDWEEYHDIDFYWVANSQDNPENDPAWSGIPSALVKA